MRDIPQCKKCVNYQKPKEPNLEDPTKNPCYESRTLIACEIWNPTPGSAVVITCMHFSCITGGTVRMKR